MVKYDLVLLLDAKLSETERKKLITDMEKTFKKNILDEDDIGLQQLAYNLKGKAGNDSAYFYSFNIQVNAEEITQLKKEFLYNKGLKRYFIYRMDATQPYYKFAALNKELTDIIEAQAAKKLGQKVSFFADKRNAKYLCWKAIPMIKKYVTRFGDMKPRKYTDNSVATQKKLRTIIARVRELGLVGYTKE